MVEEKKVLRIGIDGRVMQERKPSGIPQYAIKTIEEILRLDKENHYIIIYNSFRDISSIVPKFNGANVELKFYGFPNKFLEWFWKLIPYPKIDRLLNLDIFFSPHFINIPLSPRVKKILTIHDLSFVKNKKYFSWKKNLWHWQMNPRKFCQNSNKIIAVSESTKNDLVNLYKIDPEKIKVIYNGYSSNDLLSPREINPELLEKKFSIERKKYILFLATLEPRKNIEGVIEAFRIIEKEIPDYKLVISGKKGWLFEKIFFKAKKYNLENRIVFTDFVSEEEKIQLLSNTSLFVFPSFFEGFGLPVLEALNYEVPIITSNTSSLPEIVRDSAILINPHDINEIAEGMILILKNENLRKKIIEKEKEIRNDFSWEKTGKETLEYLLS